MVTSVHGISEQPPYDTDLHVTAASRTVLPEKSDLHLTMGEITAVKKQRSMTVPVELPKDDNLDHFNAHDIDTTIIITGDMTSEVPRKRRSVSLLL